MFGIFNRRLELIALAHLAHRAADASRGRAAASEFGVSVLPKARRRGFGRRLFEHAMLHARNRGVETMFIHALSENTAMLKLARNAGATDRARRLGVRSLAQAAARLLRLAPRRAAGRPGRRARLPAQAAGAARSTPSAEPDDGADADAPARAES